MSPVVLASWECGFAETGRPALCIRLSAPGTINGLLKERHNKNFVYVAKQKLDIEVKTSFNAVTKSSFYDKVQNDITPTAKGTVKDSCIPNKLCM